MSYLSDLLGDSYKEGMTEEEISTALQAAGAGQNNDAEINRLKAQLSKANSEAADYKKQLRGKQTADEAAAAEQKATMDKLTQENTDLKRSIALADKKTKLVAMGYDEKLADSTAIAMVDGDMDTVMKNQATFNESREKAIRAEQMKKTPRPAAGSDGTGGMDYATELDERLTLLEQMTMQNDFSAPLATDDEAITLIVDDLDYAILADWKYKEE